MPLRDHFRPPLSAQRSWDELHGAWPTVMVMALNEQLPRRYVAAPRVHLGASFEIDVASFDEDPIEADSSEGAEGGVSMAVWSPPQPTLTVASDLPDQDEYEVRVYDTYLDRRLVAAVEIVSPANKDRPEHRGAFVARCAALLREQVSVTIVDVVTTRRFNLYGELLELIGQSDPALASGPPALYAATCRGAKKDNEWLLQTWMHGLAVGRPLPTLPLWLGDHVAVPLELETSYEQACRVLRIA
ncbi:MAG: DUF4058 family protein [Planctomycetes bacterium]|nr:DUF4058 family protein [Planctomycetota bacterium]